MISNPEAYPEDKQDALMYEGTLSHLTQFTQAAVDYAQRTISKARALPLSPEADMVLELTTDDEAAGHLLNIIDGRGFASLTYRIEKLQEYVEESLCQSYDDGDLHD